MDLRVLIGTIRYTEEGRPILPRTLKYVIVFWPCVHDEEVMLLNDYLEKWQGLPTGAFPLEFRPFRWSNYPHHAKTAFEDWCKKMGY